MNIELKNQNDGGRDALKSNLWGMFLLGILLLVDILTKIVADAYFSQEGAPSSIVIIPGYLDLRMSYNTGMAFSMGADAPTEAKIALVVGTGVIFVGLTIFYFMLDKRRTWLRIAIIFIVAGGIGNFIDRVLYLADPTALAGVRDMVRLKILMFDFGVCNFADFFIVGGAIALMISILFFDAGAIYPLTKKYKELAKEYEAKEEAKKAKKQEAPTGK